MHAFLLIGDKDKDKAINNIIGKNRRVDFGLQKIENVRDLRSLSKYHSGEKMFFVLDNFQTATIEAMNALLKLLEEPSENVNFILCANEKKNILETVISRCRVIKLGHLVSKESTKMVRDYLNSALDQKLAKLHSTNDRSDALSFLTMLIEGGHQLILKSPEKGRDYTEIIESAIRTKTDIERNANVTLALTRFSLDLV